MSKQEVRKSVLSILKNLPDRAEKSRRVAENFLALPQIRSARAVALFMSTMTEPDTSYIISELLSRKITVCLPKVDGVDMYFVKVTPATEFVSGAFGIKEPVGEKYDGDFDVMAVPLVAFDERNNRLGHGKGYYDKYLRAHSCFTVGLAFSEQKRDVPVDPWDVPLDLVIAY